MMGDSAAGRLPRLLLVEDSDTQALRIRRMLESQGFEVERVSSGEDALDLLGRDIPDLVIADYHLPGMNGGQMARQFRMNASTRLVPVLMLTEGAEPGLEREGLESGADAYISKSALPEVLVLRIRALLRESARQGGGEDVRPFRRARIVVLSGHSDTDERRHDALVDILSRDGHLVTVEHDPAGLIESGWLDPDRAPDCVVVDLVTDCFDGLDFCRRLDALRQRVLLAGDVPLRILGFSRQSDYRREDSVRLYEAGVDDLVPEDIEPDVLALRIRVLVRRKLGQDEIRRQDAQRQAHEAAVASARREASANAAKASLAEALEQANRELARANHALIEAQGKLVQSAKMASLGELVAGIAHEINNPLAFTLAHKDTVERGLERLLNEDALSASGDARQDVLRKCSTRVGSMALGLKRIQNLVVSLRKFSRLDEGSFQEVDVPESFDVALALLTHKLGSGIEVERDLQAPAVLYCQPALMNQVVMNLLSNATDAISKEAGEAFGPERMAAGRIRVRTYLLAEDDDQSSDYVIEVDDSGPGIPPEVRERIFEPFFTTKPVGAGTGLGLAIAYSVMQAHQGSITIGVSDLGGARFTLRVPYRPLEDMGLTEQVSILPLPQGV